jgi:hypothetical protein
MPYLSDITSNFSMIAKFLSFDLEKIFHTRHVGMFMNYSHTKNNNCLLVKSPSRLRPKNISARASRSTIKHKNCILFRNLREIISCINCRYGHSYNINSSVRLTVGLTIAHKQTSHTSGKLQHTCRSWSMIKM